MFPSSRDHKAPFKTAGFSYSDQFDEAFPRISIIYQDIEAVMRAYVGQFRISVKILDLTSSQAEN